MTWLEDHFATLLLACGLVVGAFLLVAMAWSVYDLQARSGALAGRCGELGGQLFGADRSLICVDPAGHVLDGLR